MPFAGYRNFSDCISKNKGKKNPQAYCATIMRAVEQPSKKRHYSKGAIERARRKV